MRHPSDDGSRIFPRSFLVNNKKNWWGLVRRQVYQIQCSGMGITHSIGLVHLARELYIKKKEKHMKWRPRISGSGLHE
jgi:hypothetical protein